jgi:hypothetical protein
LDASAESANAEDSATPSESDDASKQPAIASLVLGIVGVAIQLVGVVAWAIAEHQADEAMKRLLAGEITSAQSPGANGIVVLSLLSLPVGIGAIVFGVRGRRRPKANAQSRIASTIGLALGIVCVAVPILAGPAFIAWVSCCIDTL